MQFWLPIKRISLCLALGLCLTATASAQKPEPDSAYSQVMNQPFQRLSLDELPRLIPVAPGRYQEQKSPQTGSKISPTANVLPPQTATYLQGEVITPFDHSPTTDNTHQTKSAHVVVQPPMVQPYKKNQFSFVIENRGQLEAEDLKIELRVDNDARIVAMLPTEAVVSDQTALLNVKQLKAGEHINVHLTATSKSDGPIRFTARLVHASEQVFDSAASRPKISVSPIETLPKTAAQPFTVQALPASTNQSKVVPILTAPKAFQPRPHFQSNPYFEGQTTAKPLRHPLQPKTPFRSVSSGGLTTSVGPVANRASTTFSDGDFAPRKSAGLKASTKNDVNEINLSDKLHEPDDMITGPAPHQTFENAALVPDVSLPSPISGPRNVYTGDSQDFSLQIDNPTDAEVESVLVQLKIPEGMEVVTFDRETWYDESSGVVSFRIPRIAAGDSEPVDFCLKALQSGFQILKLTVEADQLPSTGTPFDVFVRD
jgi:hypothetical protein